MRYLSGEAIVSAQPRGAIDREDRSGSDASNSVATVGKLPASGHANYKTGFPTHLYSHGAGVGRPVKRKNGRVVVLHRDVFWLGSQWAVTGFGVQAVSARHEMKFDIEASRIWEDNLADALSQHDWFDRADFEQALAFARKRAKDQPTTFQFASSDER